MSKMQLSMAVAIIVLAFWGKSSRIEAYKDGCHQCGEVEIPYPFGTVAKNCAFESKYLTDCKDSKAFLHGTDIRVTNISLGDGELTALQNVTKYCYDLNNNSYSRSTWSNDDFYISGTKNKFFTVGCNHYAWIDGKKPNNKLERYGGISLCSEKKDVNLMDQCNGANGCAKTSLTGGLKNFTLSLDCFDDFRLYQKILEFNKCGFAFVRENTKFNFSNFEDLSNMTKVPLVLDWSIGNVNCEEAQKSDKYLKCARNSRCVNSASGSGYFCKCFEGYQGNPYQGGCQDIDECKMNKTICGTAECMNKPGSWSCKCPKGYESDKKEKLCKAPVPTNSAKENSIRIGLGVAIGLIALLLISFPVCWQMKKKELKNLREKFFKQNGGLILLEKLSNQLKQEESQSSKIFTEEELRRATDNFHESRIVGQGGYGIVYKGILPNKSVVAIKRSKHAVQAETEQFINEVMVLSQINHRNVVRLLGCCLETEIPLLVYEFISKGTLFEHIHDKCNEPPLSWDLRVKIAAETAGVLAYLHSECSTQIIHRDVKTTNVLIDDNYTAKVSDFGASRQIPLNRTQVTTLVQGTLGYLDPEYFQTGQLTEKSDVYSFGVVLAELLTGEKAVSSTRPKNDINLAIHFISSMEKDLLLQILDKNAIEEGRIEEIKDVAKLAVECLRVNGQERPTMKKVAMVLEGLRTTEINHSWGESSHFCQEEMEGLLGATSPINAFRIEIDGESGSNST